MIGAVGAIGRQAVSGAGAQSLDRMDKIAPVTGRGAGKIQRIANRIGHGVTEHTKLITSMRRSVEPPWQGSIVQGFR